MLKNPQQVGDLIVSHGTLLKNVENCVFIDDLSTFEGSCQQVYVIYLQN